MGACVRACVRTCVCVAKCDYDYLINYYIHNILLSPKLICSPLVTKLGTNSVGLVI